MTVIIDTIISIIVITILIVLRSGPLRPGRRALQSRAGRVEDQQRAHPGSAGCYYTIMIIMIIIMIMIMIMMLIMWLLSSLLLLGLLVLVL